MMDWRAHIEFVSDVMMGNPVLKGPRLTVETILDWLAAGWTDEMLCEKHPRLTPEGLRAIYAFAREVVAEQRYVVPARAA